ncbi:MAG: hypothetical protein ACTHLE_16365 [Agriterribacter sp.]
MKKIMLALLSYVLLSACGGGSAERVEVDSLTGNDTSSQMPSDTVYPKSDTASLNRDTTTK